MRWWVALVSIVLAGCGRLHYEPGASDASMDAPGLDAPQDAAAIDEPGPLTYRDVVMEDSPLAYWRLGDDADIARDETGRFDGTYTPACSVRTAGVLAEDPDSAVRFDGMSCQISIPSGFEFPGVAPFSLEVWVSVTSSDGYYHFITREERMGGLPYNGYALFQYAGGVSVERASLGMLEKTDDIRIRPNRVTHLVGTYDGTMLRMYIDGTLVREQPATAEIPAFTATPVLATNSIDAYVNGVMDEIAIYDHALAAERVALHHRIGTVGPD